MLTWRRGTAIATRPAKMGLSSRFLVIAAALLLAGPLVFAEDAAEDVSASASASATPEPTPTPRDTE